MPRLIDAEKALDNLEEMRWYHLNNDGKLVEGSRSDFISFITYYDAKRSIEDSATVDAVPVRHGHWDCVDDDANVWSCSACKEEWVLEAGNPVDNGMKYCCYCGALMDEAVNSKAEVQDEQSV